MFGCEFMEKYGLELPLSSFFDDISSIKDDTPNFKMLIGGKWRDAHGGSQLTSARPLMGA